MLAVSWSFQNGQTPLSLADGEQHESVVNALRPTTETEAVSFQNTDNVPSSFPTVAEVW